MSTTSTRARPAMSSRTQRLGAPLTVVVVVLLATLGAPLTAQVPATYRLWAAQTGQNQVSLAWDSVPGAAAYRVYFGDPTAPATFARRPVSVLSAGARGAILSGIQRMIGGITLESADVDGRILRRQAFNPISPATSFPPATPPTQLTADAPSASEVRVAWDAVPGATAYFIGRSVAGSGFSALCTLCSTEPFYVDQAVMSGQRHAYTVAAIFPSGVSTRVNSNAVTPGQIATASPVSTSGQTATTGQAVVPGTLTSTGSATPSASTGTGTTTTPAPGTSAPAGAPAPPSVVTATATGPGAVRVTWQPSTSPGVTAYYVQRNHTGALPGFVSRVDPNIRLYDDGVYPASAFSSGPLWVTYSVFSYSATGTASTNSNAVLVPVPGGSTTYTPPGQPASTLPAPSGTSTTGATASGSTPTGTTATGTTATTSSTTNGSTSTPPVVIDSVGTTLGGIGTALGNLFTGGPQPPTAVTATATGPAAARVTWQPSPSANVTEYIIGRMVSGRLPEMLNTVPATAQSYDDGFFPATLFTSGPLQVTYSVTTKTSTGIGTVAGKSNAVAVQPPASGAGTPSASVATCRLDYQRADNMWAAFGRPDGPLGTESLTLTSQQNKVFITDWKYEKQRNDGTNFYGSHLRIASNPTAHTIRLQLRSLNMTGLSVLFKTGSNTFWIRLDPNTSKLFQADLMEVFCEG